MVQNPTAKIHYEITVGDDILPEEWLAEKPLPIAARRLNEYLQDYLQGNHMSNLENQIKQLIIDSLGLEDITVADIGSGRSAFRRRRPGSGFG